MCCRDVFEQTAPGKEVTVNAVIYLYAMNDMDHRQRRQQGEQWLYQAVAACGHPEVTAQSCPILRTEKGKPYFEACPQIHFSISHSKAYWACVVADGPVGLDLQYHKEGRLESIARRFFHPQEAAWLDSLSEDMGRQAFFDVWTAKESYVKWTGEGIDRHFKDFSVADEQGLLERCGDACFWRSSLLKGYSLCLCGGEPWDEVTVVQRFGADMETEDL